MNASEKNVLRLALCLFVLGVLVRFLPWGLPSIEMIQVEDRSLGDFLLAKGTAQDSSGHKIVDKVTVDSLQALSPVSPEKSNAKKKKTKKKVALPLHINAASAEDLCALNGVGPKLAEKIIQRREAFGPFKTPKDLEKVQGIGKKKLESILPGVIFD